MNAIETLNHWGGRFADFALPMLVQSSLLIVVLFALDLVLRNRVRAVVRYALWMLVLIKLVLPPSFAAPTSLAYWLPQKKAVKTPPAPSPQFAVRYSDVRFDEVSALPTLPPPRAKLQFAGWLLLGWLATALALIAWLVSRSRSVVQTAARALPASESPEQLLDACLQQMGIKQRVRFKLSVTPGSPAVCGLWRPVILIPQQLVEKLSALQLRAVLLHELAHIKRSDVLVHYAQTLLQIIYWWHPLLWLANAQIRRVREQAVDEMVMIQMGVDAETYPTTLLEVARLAFKRPMLALGLIGIVESKSDLSKRIRSLINRPVPKSARLGFTGLVALLLAGAAFLPMARGQRTPYQPPRVVAEPGQQSVVVAMDVKFIEIKESELAFLDLGEPTLTEFNGHRAWALTPEQLNGVLQRALEQTGADVLAANRVTTLSGRQSQIQLVDIASFEGTKVRVGPTCDLIPIVSGELIDLAVVASVTERRPVDPIAPFSSIADSFRTNDVGTARVIVGDGGGVVLENPEARSSKGNRYLVIVSATLVPADPAAENQTLNQASVATTSAATQKQEAPPATFQNATPTPPTNSPKSQPSNIVTNSEPQVATKRFALSTEQDDKIEIFSPNGSGIEYDLETGICIVTNDFGARFKGTVLTARRGQVNTKTGEVIAEGDVTLQRGDQVLRYERLQYNFIHQKGTDINASSGAPSDGGQAGDGSVSPSASRHKEVPVLGDLPFAGRLFRSEATPGSLGRQRIQSALNRIVLPQIVFDNMRLPEVLQWLSKQALEHDSEGEGLNFLLNPNVIGAARQTPMEPTTVDPITGKPITLPSSEPLDMNTVIVRINPPLRNVRLADAVEAIVRVADKPIRYSIEDYAVIFSPKPPETTQLETRIFQLNSRLFPENLREQMVGDVSTNVQESVRRFFEGVGVSVLPPNHVFYNDRRGVLMIRATAKELDIAQNSLELLNYSPPQITIEAKFVEVGGNDAKELGFDWLLGNFALANGTKSVPNWPPVVAADGTDNFVGILTASQVKIAFKVMEQRPGTDILSAPRVTTLSGRQTEISVLRATEVSGKVVQAGPALEIMPIVSADGITLDLVASATVTDVLKYRGIPRARTRKVQGKAAVYDGQTLLLIAPTMSAISRQPDGRSVKDVAETGKWLLVFITPTIIDPAGNPIHPPGEEPFPIDKVPAQAPR